jgi:DNA modification methylase
MLRSEFWRAFIDCGQGKFGHNETRWAIEKWESINLLKNQYDTIRKCMSIQGETVMEKREIIVKDKFIPEADVILHKGDTRDLLKTIPKETIQLIVTSPPYNIGKEYEKKQELENYIEEQKEIINMCIPLLSQSGSICWQVGNYISSKSEVVPLDILLYDIFKSNDLVLRNRSRFSGRYETVSWFTRDTKDYYFDLDAVRIPQKYPGKRSSKGSNIGKYSGHPAGKNPSDVWDIPNVKANHVEKTEHPCQYPIGLVQRLVKALTKKGDWVLDPFLGSGSTACVAIIEERKAIGAEIVPKYQKIAEERIKAAWYGNLKFRPHDQPIYVPKEGSKLTRRGGNVED